MAVTDERPAFHMSCPTTGSGPQPSDLPEALTAWFAKDNTAIRTRGITAQLRHSPKDGRLKNSAGLTAEAGNRAIQITVWNSSEAELNFVDRASSDTRPEHRDLQTEQELHLLLESLLDWVVPGPNG
ncbi:MULTISPECIES: hypothetical protein [Streptomyces]